MKRLLPLLCVLLLTSSVGAVAGPKDSVARPNILWITCEDMSPNLGCYGDAYARTPNLDALARQSVRYTHAFATAPACSPSRSALITGMYATSLNTQHLRSAFPIPEQFKAFPTYLRAAGYYCSNNRKTDYNTANERRLIEEAWNDCDAKAHWRKRGDGKPFFSVFNFTETHQSRTSMGGPAIEKQISAALSPAERHDPAAAPIPPYYPDTALVRQTLARYYDAITMMDKEVGRLLKELKEDDLDDDTIVFFFSDHGMGMPRGKRTLFDSGMRVPLLVRFPEKFRHLAPAPVGGTEDRLVSFVDFAPTVLSLVGLNVPKHMQGVPFLGREEGGKREFIFGARDRVDEAFDLARSVRDKRYLYIRNYMPHLSWNQPEGSSDRSAMRREITKLAEEGKLNDTQMTYAAPTRAVEELYDSEADPHQVRNLAASQKHQSVLKKMRKQVHDWVLHTRDVGFAPEEEVWARLHGDTPFTIASDEGRFPLRRILDAAEMVGSPDDSKIARVTVDSDSIARYWGLVALRASGAAAALKRDVLMRALNDKSPAVRIEAAAELLRLGEGERALASLVNELDSPEPAVVLHAARALQLLGEKAAPALDAMKRARAKCGDAEYKIYLTFAVDAFAERLGRR